MLLDIGHEPVEDGVVVNCRAGSHCTAVESEQESERVITIVELALGFGIYFMHKGEAPSHLLILIIKGVICILSLAKAFYIVSIFMHLGDEIRNLIMTIVVPLMLFIWFIAAFLIDGNSWKNLRNTDGHSHEYVEPAHKAAPAQETAPEAVKPGSKE